MDFSYIYLYTMFFISIFILIVAAVIAGAFVIPLQWKEIGVKNGLAQLRKQLLARGSLSWGVIFIAVVVLGLRYVIHDMVILRYTTVTLVFVFAVFHLMQVLIDLKIYRQNYTEEAKKLHAIIDALERGEAKIVFINKKKE